MHTSYARHRPKAMVRQDALGRWYFVLVKASGATLYEGLHHIPGPGSKALAMEDRDVLCGNAARADYVTENA
jgi:hypothetical protein